MNMLAGKKINPRGCTNWEFVLSVWLVCLTKQDTHITAHQVLVSLKTGM
jgi:hypothetical protein